MKKETISIRKLLKAIRKNCLDCSGGVASEVVDCSMTHCPLYPYRIGVQGLYEVKEKKEE
jgi:hypothetical protein